MLGPATKLSVEDLFADASAKKGGLTLVETMRQSHHEIARLKADGRKDVEISAMTGYSQSRLSILSSSPAFAELVEFYKEKKEIIYVDTHAKIATLGNEALDAIRDDLHDGVLSASQKIELAKLALDRSGHGVQTKSTNINFNAPLQGEVLKGLQAAVAQQGRVTRLDDILQAPSTAIPFVDPLRVTSAPSHEVPAGQESRDGDPVLPPAAYPEDKASRSAGEGLDVREGLLEMDDDPF